VFSPVLVTRELAALVDLAFKRRAEVNRAFPIFGMFLAENLQGETLLRVFGVERDRVG
jgi:hypothetical protein